MINQNQKLRLLQLKNNLSNQLKNECSTLIGSELWQLFSLFLSIAWSILSMPVALIQTMYHRYNTRKMVSLKVWFRWASPCFSTFQELVQHSSTQKRKTTSYSSGKRFWDYYYRSLLVFLYSWCPDSILVSLMKIGLDQPIHVRVNLWWKMISGNLSTKHSQKFTWNFHGCGTCQHSLLISLLLTPY